MVAKSVLRCCRQEVEALRKELSEAHTHSSQRALAALAQERDAAITETRQAWDRERSSLRETASLSNLSCTCT